MKLSRADFITLFGIFMAAVITFTVYFLTREDNDRHALKQQHIQVFDRIQLELDKIRIAPLPDNPDTPDFVQKGEEHFRTINNAVSRIWEIFNRDKDYFSELQSIEIRTLYQKCRPELFHTDSLSTNDERRHINEQTRYIVYQNRTKFIRRFIEIVNENIRELK